MPPDPAEIARLARAWVQDRAEGVLADVGALVALETPSEDAAALGAAAAALPGLLRIDGGRVMSHDGGRAPHLAVDTGEPAVLLLTHYDTVWPVGTAAARPFAVAGDRAAGPGVVDMKASLAMAAWALAARRAVAPEVPPLVRLSLTPDEEIGNPATGARLAAWAAASRAVLVLEPPLPGGALKTARKGIATARLEVTGRAAHAGLDPHLGVNAAVQAARAALHAHGLADPGRGLTVNVGALAAGGPANVVPARGEVVVDIRGWDEADLDRVIGTLEAWAAEQKGAAVTVAGQVHRPPWRRSAASDGALAAAQAIAAALGIALGEGEAGGGSEANLVADAGAPLLDGLGPDGGGAHAVTEHISVRSLLDRIALLAGVTAALEAG